MSTPMAIARSNERIVFCGSWAPAPRWPTRRIDDTFICLRCPIEGGRRLRVGAPLESRDPVRAGALPVLPITHIAALAGPFSSRKGPDAKARKQRKSEREQRQAERRGEPLM